jgi:D-alanyl-D-alanine carboxypeptidase/D-alanyl-D-alanine-endopeptidase (penicillin-binding protein 4)
VTRPRLAARPAPLLGLLLLGALAPAFAAKPLGRALEEQVRAARRVSPSLGVHVVEVESGAEVYGYHADEVKILASNTKLFTTAAAVDLLGPDFQFETGLLIRGAVYDGILDGDLAVVGGGDPNLSGRLYDGDPFGAFRAWAAALRERGVRRVSGSLFLVHGLFDGLAIHPDWPTDQLARWYEAPVGALSFNDNCVLVRVSPGPRPGTPGRVELEPELGLFRVIGQVGTSGSRGRHHVVVSREPESREVRVAGSIYVRGEPLEAWVTVPDPVEYFGAALRAALAQEGVEVHGGTVPTARLPGAVWERVFTHRTDLVSTIAVVNRRSQNFYAESVLKVLGARLAGEGSWRSGVAAVEAFLAKVGLAGGVELADGSGMSRGNRAAPRHLTELLRFMFFHPAGADFVLSLPASGGEEPAWQRRLAQAPYRGNVFAKTGTLDGVSALSGYAKGASGRLYAFSVLCNGTSTVWQARRAQDSIVRAIIDHG